MFIMIKAIYLDTHKKHDNDDDEIAAIFELTTQEASLSKVLQTKRLYTDILKYDVPKVQQPLTESVLAVKLNVPTNICQLIAVFATDIPHINKRINANLMTYVVAYLKHHNGKTPMEIPKPIISIHMKHNVADI